MTNQVLSRNLTFLSCLLVCPLLSCGGDGGNTTGPGSDDDPAPVSVVISGPLAVTLGCSLEGSAAFTSSLISGSFNTLAWRVDGLPAGEGRSLEARFNGLGDHEVVLLALSSDHVVLDADTVTVSATPPTDIPSCISDSGIEGEWGVLLPTGVPSVSTGYVAKAPAAIGSGFENYTWRLSYEGEDPTELGSGQDLDVLAVSFDKGGKYVLEVDLSYAGTSHTVFYDIGVRAGEPLADPGSILMVVRELDRKTHTTRYMDGETGFISAPIQELYNLRIDAVCAPDMVFFGMSEQQPDLSWDERLFMMDRDGRNVKRLLSGDGDISQPDWRAGELVLAEDVRSGGSFPELTFYDLATGKYSHLAKTSTEAMSGQNPKWVPGNDAIVAGTTPFNVDGGVQYGVSKYTRQGDSWFVSRIHSLSPEEAYGVPSAVEGLTGVAVDPLGTLVAFTVDYWATTPEYFAIAAVGLDGSGFRLLDQDVVWGKLDFTPSGSHVLYQEADFSAMHPTVPEASVDIMMVPRDGGEPVSLTRATIGRTDYAHHILMGYCRQ